jgi:hypothetical protein
VASDFEAQLSAFQAWATAQSPELGSQVSRIISTNYISQLDGFGAGEVSPPVSVTTPAITTATKLGDLINSIGSTYINSAQAYYNAKIQVATMKAAAEAEKLKAAGLYATQQGVSATGNFLEGNMPLFLIGGGLLAAVLLLKR